jgi:PEP-CTERM motif-containing protein
MTSKKALVALSALALVAMGASAHAADLVQNGGFETTTTGVSSEFGSQFPSQQVAGWTSTSYSWVFTSGTADANPVVAQGIDGPLSLWGPAHSVANGLTGSPAGGNFIAVDPSYRQGTVDQIINGLVAGDVYTLNFDFAGAQQFGFDGETQEGWDVSLGAETHSTLTIDLANHGFSGWQHATMSFTATGASETLSFLATGGPSSSQPPFALLDGVSLTGGVPEPAAWSLMIMGFGGIGASVRRRRAVAATA